MGLFYVILFVFAGTIASDHRPKDRRHTVVVNPFSCFWHVCSHVSCFLWVVYVRCFL